MRREAYILISAALLASGISSCSAAPSHNLDVAVRDNILHELPYDRMPVWKMVEIKGLERDLRETYDKKIYQVAHNKTMSFEGVSYEAFKALKTSKATFSISKSPVKRKHMQVNFSICNRGAVTYKPSWGQWKFIEHVSNAMACYEPLIDESGKTIAVPTPMIFESSFLKMARNVKAYRVSKDGQTLKLLDENGEQLGLFSRAESFQ